MEELEDSGFDKALEERLSNTPVSFDEIIKVIRSAEAAAAGVMQAMHSPSKLIKYRYEIFPIIEGFLRSEMKENVEIGSIEEFKSLLRKFWTSIQARDTEWKNFAMHLFIERFSEAKAFRFAEELPRNIYEEQRKTNEQAWEESQREIDEENAEDPTPPTSYATPEERERIIKAIMISPTANALHGGKEVNKNDEYNSMHIAEIARRASLLVQDLLKPKKK